VQCLEYSTKRFIFHGLLLFTVEVREREEKGRENRGRQRERKRETSKPKANQPCCVKG
jgi:hypothetical protein